MPKAANLRAVPPVGRAAGAGGLPAETGLAIGCGRIRIDQRLWRTPVRPRGPDIAVSMHQHRHRLECSPSAIPSPASSWPPPSLGCRVYLIDNFEQDLYLVPEVRTSHGDMLLRLLQAGRDDIQVRILNTSLSKRLALVIQDLLEGVCVGCRRLLGARIELYLRADRQPAARSGPIAYPTDGGGLLLPLP